MIYIYLILFLIVLLNGIAGVESHARLLSPIARSSAWRLDPKRFPFYFNDNQMFCGGFDTQWRKNSLKF